MKARLPAQLSSEQRKAMKLAINKQWFEQDDHFSKDSDAMILWVLHVCFGFGAKRLRRFWEMCFTEHKNLKEFYEFDTSEDMRWLYRHKLKDKTGIDIDEWYKEQEEAKDNDGT